MIYLIATADRRFCKIGKAIAPHDRLAVLQTASPFELELIATRSLPDRFERQCHKKFADHHVRGEWFSFSEALLNEFSSLEIEPDPSDGTLKKEPEFLGGLPLEEFRARLSEIENPITRAVSHVRLALADGETPAGLARKAGLHRNALYGAADPAWNPKADTLEKLWPHLAA